MRSVLFLITFLSLTISATLLGQTSAKPQIVHNGDFFRTTLYTWTTAEQITVLRKNKTLLTKSRSDSEAYSLYDIALNDSSLNKNEFAKILREEQFKKKRFAWINGWATIMGWKGESYGDQLVKIELSDSAIIGKFEPENKGELFVFFDKNNQKLSQEFVLKKKDRIAAIYHMSSKKGKLKVWMYEGTIGPKKKKTIFGNVPFREYVIVNEKMIKDWSYGTEDIKNELTSEIALIEKFVGNKWAHQKAYDYGSREWSNPGERDLNPDQLFYYSKCFQNDHYLFNPEKMQAIIKKLQLALTKQSTEIKK